MNRTSKITGLYSRSKKNSLLILAATAIICSKLFFFLLNDPEGPNLLIVTGLASAVFILSSLMYLVSPFQVSGVKKLLAPVCIQLLSVVGLYFCLR